MEEGKAQSSKSLNPHLAAGLIYLSDVAPSMHMVYQGPREQYTVPTLPNSFGPAGGPSLGPCFRGGRSPMGKMSFSPEAFKNEMDKLRYSCAAWDGGSPGDGDKGV